MTDTAPHEIERLRDRARAHANLLQVHTGQIDAANRRLEDVYGNLDDKLDAIHGSINAKIAEFKADVKEDLTAIKAKQDKTNGRVSGHDREISTLQGGVIVMAAGLPVVTGLLLFVLQQLL